MGHHRLLVFGLGFDEAEEVEVGGGEFFETSRVVASTSRIIATKGVLRLRRRKERAASAHDDTVKLSSHLSSRHIPERDVLTQAMGQATDRKQPSELPPEFHCFPLSRSTQFLSPEQPHLFRENTRALMAKKAEASESVYNVVEIIGTSKQSWEEAARHAIETASKSLRDLRIAEVVKMDMKVKDGKVVEYRTRVLLSFKYEG